MNSLRPGLNLLIQDIDLPSLKGNIGPPGPPGPKGEPGVPPPPNTSGYKGELLYWLSTTNIWGQQLMGGYCRWVSIVHEQIWVVYENLRASRGCHPQVIQRGTRVNQDCREHWGNSYR